MVKTFLRVLWKLVLITELICCNVFEKNNMSCEISVIWIGVVINFTTPIFCCNQLKTIYYEHVTNCDDCIVVNITIAIDNTRSIIFC